MAAKANMEDEPDPDMFAPHPWPLVQARRKQHDELFGLTPLQQPPSPPPIPTHFPKWWDEEEDHISECGTWSQGLKTIDEYDWDAQAQSGGDASKDAISMGSEDVEQPLLEQSELSKANGSKHEEPAWPSGCLPHTPVSAPTSPAPYDGLSRHAAGSESIHHQRASSPFPPTKDAAPDEAQNAPLSGEESTEMEIDLPTTSPTETAPISAYHTPAAEPCGSSSDAKQTNTVPDEKDNTVVCSEHDEMDIDQPTSPLVRLASPTPHADGMPTSKDPVKLREDHDAPVGSGRGVTNSSLEQNSTAPGGNQNNIVVFKDDEMDIGMTAAPTTHPLPGATTSINTNGTGPQAPALSAPGDTHTPSPVPKLVVAPQYETNTSRSGLEYLSEGTLSSVKSPIVILPIPGVEPSQTSPAREAQPARRAASHPAHDGITNQEEGVSPTARALTTTSEASSPSSSAMKQDLVKGTEPEQDKAGERNPKPGIILPTPCKPTVSTEVAAQALTALLTQDPEKEFIEKVSVHTAIEVAAPAPLSNEATGSEPVSNMDLYSNDSGLPALSLRNDSGEEKQRAGNRGNDIRMETPVPTTQGTALQTPIPDAVPRMVDHTSGSLSALERLRQTTSPEATTGVTSRSTSKTPKTPFLSIATRTNFRFKGHSCFACRTRKAKCDRVHPVCGRCQRTNQPTRCTYPEAPFPNVREELSVAGDTPSRDTSSRNTPSRDTSSRNTPSRDTSSRNTPSRDTPVAQGHDTPPPAFLSTRTAEATVPMEIDSLGITAHPLTTDRHVVLPNALEDGLIDPALMEVVAPLLNPTPVAPQPAPTHVDSSPQHDVPAVEQQDRSSSHQTPELDEEDISFLSGIEEAAAAAGGEAAQADESKGSTSAGDGHGLDVELPHAPMDGGVQGETGERTANASDDTSFSPESSDPRRRRLQSLDAATGLLQLHDNLDAATGLAQFHQETVLRSTEPVSTEPVDELGSDLAPTNREKTIDELLSDLSDAPESLHSPTKTRDAAVAAHLTPPKPKARSKLGIKRSYSSRPKNPSSSRKKDKDFKPEASSSEDNAKPAKKKLKDDKMTRSRASAKTKAKPPPETGVKNVAASGDESEVSESQNDNDEEKARRARAATKQPKGTKASSPKVVVKKKRPSRVVADDQDDADEEDDAAAGARDRILTPSDLQPSYGKRTTRSDARQGLAPAPAPAPAALPPSNKSSRPPKASTAMDTSSTPAARRRPSRPPKTNTTANAPIAGTASTPATRSSKRKASAITSQAVDDSVNDAPKSPPTKRQTRRTAASE